MMVNFIKILENMPQQPQIILNMVQMKGEATEGVHGADDVWDRVHDTDVGPWMSCTMQMGTRNGVYSTDGGLEQGV